MNKERVELPDALNPEFLFSLTHSALLVDIAKGRIDPVALARKALANRGSDSIKPKGSERIINPG